MQLALSQARTFTFVCVQSFAYFRVRVCPPAWPLCAVRLSVCLCCGNLLAASVRSLQRLRARARVRWEERKQTKHTSNERGERASCGSRAPRGFDAANMSHWHLAETQPRGSGFHATERSSESSKPGQGARWPAILTVTLSRARMMAAKRQQQAAALPRAARRGARTHARTHAHGCSPLVTGLEPQRAGAFPRRVAEPTPLLPSWANIHARPSSSSGASTSLLAGRPSQSGREQRRSANGMRPPLRPGLPRRTTGAGPLSGPTQRLHSSRTAGSSAPALHLCWPSSCQRTAPTTSPAATLGRG